jgi:carboxyl-terminal processing protease
MQPPYRHPLACAIVLCAAALGSFTACSSAAVDEAAAKPAPVADARPFDPRRAWSEWIQLLTLDYGYFQRPGVDGQAIAAHFAPRAASATTRPELVALMQQMARNFADPTAAS